MEKRLEDIFSEWTPNIIGKYQLLLGDCLELIPQKIKNESVDIVVTSPPYNLNIKYNTYKDNLPRKEYLEWFGKVCTVLKKALKEDGSFFLNMGSNAKDPWIDIDVMRRAGEYFQLQNKFIWTKAISISKNRSFGHFFPINSNRFVNKTHEMIYHKQDDMKSFDNKKFNNTQRFLAMVLLGNKSEFKKYLPNNDYIPFVSWVEGKEISQDNLNEMLIIMSKHGNPLGVKLLLEKDTDIHADNDWALMSASMNGHKDIIVLLLKYGADIHAANDDALIRAIDEGHI